MGFNLWWARNDGIGGHVWLDEPDMRAVVEEMLAQGMAWMDEAGHGIPVRKLATRERKHVSAVEIADALRAASREPRTAIDAKLWRDWLNFLDEATRNGGLVVRG